MADANHAMDISMKLFCIMEVSHPYSHETPRKELFQDDLVSLWIMREQLKVMSPVEWSMVHDGHQMYLC